MIIPGHVQVPARAPILGRPPSAVPAIQDKPHALQNMILDGDMLLPTNRGSIGQFISGRPGMLVTISVSIFKTLFLNTLDVGKRRLFCLYNFLQAA